MFLIVFCQTTNWRVEYESLLMALVFSITMSDWRFLWTQVENKIWLCHVLKSFLTYVGKVFWRNTLIPHKLQLSDSGSPGKEAWACPGTEGFKCRCVLMQPPLGNFIFCIQSYQRDNEKKTALWTFPQWFILTRIFFVPIVVDWMFVLATNSHVEILTLRMMILGGRDLERWLSHKDGTLMNRICILTKEMPGSFLALSTTWGHNTTSCLEESP